MPAARQQFAVVGLGLVGRALCEALAAEGIDVLAIDADLELVQDLSDEVPDQVHLVAADATEEGVLRDLGVDRMDAAAVVIGDNQQASVLVTMQLKELGVPRVLARAVTPLHARVLERIGADEVLQPALDAGVKLARMLSAPGVRDYFDLDGDEAIMEAEVPESWVGRSLADLELSSKEGITVLVHKRPGKAGSLPRGATVFGEGDVVVVGGTEEALRRCELYC